MCSIVDDGVLLGCARASHKSRRLPWVDVLCRVLVGGGCVFVCVRVFFSSLVILRCLARVFLSVCVCVLFTFFSFLVFEKRRGLFGSSFFLELYTRRVALGARLFCVVGVLLVMGLLLPLRRVYCVCLNSELQRQYTRRHKTHGTQSGYIALAHSRQRTVRCSL